jgi:DNA-binding HxlR family transcriptional regulator
MPRRPSRQEKQLKSDRRSGCPINLALEVFGDKWSLIVIRDIIFGNRRHFGTLLSQSEEGIASNILADRLRRLTEAKLIVQAADPTHKQRSVYSLTEMAIELLPILILLAAWGTKHLRVGGAYALRSRVLERGGPKLSRKLTAELRRDHIGAQGLLRSYNEDGRPSVVLEAAIAQGHKTMRSAESAKRLKRLARAPKR